MRSALVVGGRGQVGRAVIARLAAEGWAVTATTSASEVVSAPAFGGSGELGRDGAGVSWVHFDRGHGDRLAAIVAGDVDLIVDNIAYSADHAEELIELGQRVGSAVVMSSLSVYSDAAGRSLDAANDGASFPDWPVPIPESQATVAAGEASYSTRKAAMEEALRERAPFPVTIIRPGAIHGPHSRHLREWYFIKRVVDRRPVVVLPFDGRSVFQPTATVNLAELVRLAADHPGPRTLNCGDDDPPTVAEIRRIVDRLLGGHTEQVLVAGPVPATNVGDHPWAVPRPVVAAMTQAATELGYRDVAAYPDALEDTVAWAAEVARDRDWREVFPTLAGYAIDMFDYAAEDAYLGRPSAKSGRAARPGPD